jgi:glucose-1-phosphate thymidylyltransferase
LPSKGVYRFNPTFFKVYSELKPFQRKEMAITGAISLFNDYGSKIIPHHVEGWWKDGGEPEDVLEANHLILDRIEAMNERRVNVGASVVGRVRIGKGMIIYGRSVVNGPVIIGEN